MDCKRIARELGDRIAGKVESQHTGKRRVLRHAALEVLYNRISALLDGQTQAPQHLSQYLAP